ncbi:alpha/beta fold hydrolase [Actinomycetospora straminea]|uniref:Carrier domain-containing protein n=1 Tax=Actinomycetospora straminea TaxID=663607 RepID=A0ABP9DZD2_9PSEU|nr:alpha/beta fold hydrolase [Actinomycetospora straminea]MDD7935262.1 alpha/beta fold hydrolase [Actinomycetospora straminea]
MTPTERRIAAVWAPLLGVDEAAIGRDDHFFDRGGSSLQAVTMVLRLGKEVSLSEVTRHPVLADLAALIDERPAPSTGLLHVLSDPGEGGRATLVGLPPAGGHAVNFRPLATALRGSGLAVHAVELPGHDPDGSDDTDGALLPLDEVADRVAAETADLPGVVLWGHSAGAATALAVARRLEERGTPARRVVIGAQLLGDADARRRDAAELAARSDADLLASSAAPPDLAPDRAARAAAAFRHDCLAAHGYLVGALEDPPADRLATPVTVVLAADDPSTAGREARHRDWGLFARQVDLHVLDDGGHHFLRTRPAAAARVVRAATDPVPSP